MNGKSILNYLQDGGTFNQKEAAAVCTQILEKALNDFQIAGVLALLSSRPLGVDEVLGFRSVIKDKGQSVNLGDFEAVDVCGTGGDGKNTFNISTASAFIVAACGYKVVKHGNYAVSSSFGSSDLIQSLGYVFSTDQEKLKKEIDQTNICFLHAPLFYPILKEVAPIRKGLGVKTIFNVLGPLLNPADVSNQVAGVYDMSIFRLYNEVFKSLKNNYFVVHSLDGYDELSLTAKARISGNEIDHEISPDSGEFLDAKIKRVNPENISILNKDPKDEFLKFLSGKANSDLNEVVSLSAALAITTFKKLSLKDAREKAIAAILSGTGKEILDRILGLSK